MEAFEQNADGFVFNAVTGTREVRGAVAIRSTTWWAASSG